MSEASKPTRSPRWAFWTAYGIFTTAALTGVFIAHTDPLWAKVLISVVGAMATGVIIELRDRYMAASA